MKNIITTLFPFLFVLLVNHSFAISYVSAGAGPADWNSATTWTPNGIPTQNDDVTISAGHTVTVTTNNNKCRALTLSGTLSWTANVTLLVYGDYSITATGLETSSVANAKLQFNSPGTLVSVAGTSSTKVYYNFVSNRTITSGSVISKTNAYFQIQASKTVTNLGTLTIQSFSSGSGAAFINGANANLTLRANTFANISSFNASASGNTVTIAYPTGNIPTSPSGYYNLSLNSTATGTKTMTSNLVVSRNLTIAANNTLNTNNFDLSVGGNWVKNGTFTASAGKTVTFNGTSAQTISGTGTTTFKRLSINNTAGVSITSGTYILDEVLTLSNGTFSTGGNSFTMTSTASQTARIAPITGTGAISGNFTIQRFITTRDTTWADMSSPVQSTTFADWEAELPGRYYGAYPTQYSYDESADDFVGIFSSGTTITPGKGYEVFLTGGYSYTDLPNTTLTTIGIPNQGNQNLTSLISFNNAGSNLVGNPFASSISLGSVYSASSGIENYFDVYDYTTGNYTTLGLSDEIGSGQGFWVYTNSGSYSLNINENAKTTSSNSSLKTTNAIAPYFALNVSSNVNSYSHNVKFSAKADASNGFAYGEDRLFHKSPNRSAPSITCLADGKKLNLNVFNANQEEYSIPLTVSGIPGTYTISASGIEFIEEQFSCISLEDIVLHKIIRLNEGDSYSFLLNPNETSERFVLHFSKSGNCKSQSSSAIVSLENQILILQKENGNTINFNLNEASNTTISVINMLGQSIVESSSLIATNQSVSINLPEGFSGVYIVRVENSNGMISKKFIKK